MIHVVTLEPFEPEAVQLICRALFVAYGVGCEHAGELEVPEDAQSGDGIDVVKLLAEAPQVKTFADDKILFLVQSKLVPRESPMGPLPTQGYAKYGGDKAVASVAGLSPAPGSGTPEDALALSAAKLAVHQVGHLWDLHHCLDHRCSMLPPWGVLYAHVARAELCAFCRDKSERRMKLSPA